MNIKPIFPFLWIRNGETDKISAEIRKIKECGIDAFCVESRVHTDFCGEEWFSDFDVILSEAARHDMQVWILDDISYPTGYANGYIEKFRPDLRARYIKALNTDAVGPAKGAKFIIPREEGDRILGAYLFKRSYDGIKYDTKIDVTSLIYDGLVEADLPEGQWRLVVMAETFSGYERPYFIDMLNPESVDCLINSVYLPFYARYKDHFGKTIAGFFSDEPRLCNGASFPDSLRINAYQNTLGLIGMAYPFSQKVQQTVLQGEDNSLLAALWYDIGERTSEIRCRFMKTITDLYAQNFSSRLADWCNKRGVLYAGHIIEDMGAHTRTGCGAGHYFKSQQGADFASVDAVLHQIKPGAGLPFIAPIAGGKSDPLFFNYTLAKLASSAAHIDPKKNGKALCEIFGAYGWGESIKDMMWLTNHFLVRGINHFIPHAFSMRKNDADCPPHFYALGDNPSYQGYKMVFRYMREMCEKFSGGRQIVSVAILYHAEAEWSGKKYQPLDEAARLLTQNQIDFDIIPSEAIKNIEVADGIMKLGQSEYKALIVPYSDYLPHEVINGLADLKDKAPVVFIEKDVPFAKLKDFLFERGYYDVRLTREEPSLRVMHYVKEGMDYFMLFNEGKETIANSFIGGSKFTLGGGQSLIVNSVYNIPDRPDYSQLPNGIKVGRFKVYLRESDNTEYAFYKDIDGDFDINSKGEKPFFSGFIKYAAKVYFENPNKLYLDFDGEYCTVTVGGLTFSSIDKAAIFDISGLPPDEYKVEIVLNNTLAYRYRDYFSIFNPLEKVSLNALVLF